MRSESCDVWRKTEGIKLGQLQAGTSVCAFQNWLSVSTCIGIRFMNSVNVTWPPDRPRPGRPLVTSTAGDKFIRLYHLRVRFRRVAATSMPLPGGHRNSDRTVRRRLADDALRYYRSVSCIASSVDTSNHNVFRFASTQDSRRTVSGQSSVIFQFGRLSSKFSEITTKTCLFTLFPFLQKYGSLTFQHDNAHTNHGRSTLAATLEVRIPITKVWFHSILCHTLVWANRRLK